MKKLFYLTIFMLPFIAFSQSQDYLGQWRNSDTIEPIEIISDTIYYYEIIFWFYTKNSRADARLFFCVVVPRMGVEPIRS